MSEFLQLISSSAMWSDVSFSRIAWLAGGGGLGAFLRYRLGLLCTAYFGAKFPYGVLLANVLGSFLMGALTAGFILSLAIRQLQDACIAEGVLGALTTYSTFSIDVFMAWHEGKRFIALLNLAATILCGLGSAASGYSLVVWMCVS